MKISKLISLVSFLVLIYSSLAISQTWTAQVSGTTKILLGVSFTDANNGTAVGQSGIILRTINGGTIWTSQTSGTTSPLRGVSFTDVNNGTAVGQGGTILRTTNGGTTWISQNSGTLNELRGVSFTNMNNGTVVGDLGIILRTTNGGNWTSQTSGTTNSLLGVSFTDANNGTVVGVGGTILRTTNGGTTWINQTSGTLENLWSVSFTDAINGTAVGDGGIILRTTNGGTTWTSQSSGSTSALRGVSFTNVNNGTAVGYGTILRTTNGGTAWISQTSGFTYWLWSVSFNDLNNGTAVGDGGTILRTTNGGTTIQLTSPNGSETWQVGVMQNITWSSNNVTSVKLEYSINNGTNWTTIISSTTASIGSYVWIIPNTPSTKCKVRVTDINNAVVFDESNDVFTINNEMWTVYDTSNSGLPNNNVFAISIVEGGEKWIGTEKGLAKFDGTNWVEYSTINSGIPNDDVRAICIDSKGQKWVGTAGGLVKFDGINWTVYNNNFISSMVIDHNGNIWAGIWGDGVVQFNGTNWTTYNTSNSGLLDNRVRTIAEDLDGSMWFGTVTGLVKFNGTSWINYTSALPHPDVYSLAIDKAGIKWIGTNAGGMAKYDGTNWTLYNTSNSGLPSDGVFSIIIDSYSTKWIGTWGQGLVKYDGTNWTVYNNANSGLPDNSIRSITLDDIGKKWIGTNIGGVAVLNDGTAMAKTISLLSPNGGESFVAGTVDTIKWTSTNITNVELEYSTNSGIDWTAIIASTPASSGKYAWTIPNTPSTQCKVKISDVDNASIADTSGIFTITAPVQKITVTSPNGGERWRGNSRQQITWSVGSKQSAVSKEQESGKLKVKSGKLNSTSENREPATLNQLLTTNNSIENVRIDYSTNNGVNWTTVVNGISAAQNSYTWLLPRVNSQNCKIRIVDQVDTTSADTSDAVFEIYSPQITVTSPNGGEQWQVGSSHAITWTQSNNDTIKISYSTNQGTGWLPIAEIPASAGSYSWTIPSTVSLLCKVKISDKADSSFADSSNAYFTIAFAPTVNVVVTSPNGGENWKVGETHNITWTSSNIDSVKIELTTNNGTNWTTIKGSVKASLGTFAWTIPNTPSTQCKVRISDFKNTAVGDSSNAVFTIELVVQKTIAVTSPNGGESWKVGSAQSIAWTSSNINKFKIEYTSNNGTNWALVGYASVSPYSWTIPNSVSAQCKVRISDSTNAAVWDTSKAAFTIYKPSIAVIYPNGGEALEVGTNINVTWQSSNVQNVAIEYSTTNKRTWNTVSASVAASDQSISWTVPDAVSDSCFIRIKDVSDNTVADTSNAKFKIIPSSPSSLTLTSPVGNEQWRIGTKHFITWTKNKVTTVKIEFSSNDGSSWTTLTSTAAADSGKYEWTVPNSASLSCRIKISDAGNVQVFSMSALPFTIYYAEIVVTAPNGGEQWMVSETKAISWTSTGVNKVKVELTTNNGSTWTVVKDSATASVGNISWVVPNLPSVNCKVRLSDANDLNVTDISDQVFAIKGLPNLQVLSPKAGDVWEVGTTDAITWYTENIEKINIAVSTNSGVDWLNLALQVQASDQSYNWEVQNYLSQNCLVKISDAANPSFSDTSDVFSIVAKVKPVVLTPNGGEKLTLGQAYNITWKLGSGKFIAPKVSFHKSSAIKAKGEMLGTVQTSNIRIQLSTDDGVSWAEIKNQIAVDSAKFTWTVSGEPSDKCFIKIVDINDASNFDLSDSAFVILDNKFPNILVSTNSLDFGNVYKDSTEVKQINITNTGTADLQIQSTSFYQTSSAYKVTSFNQTIKPDSTRNVSISFKPTEIASYSDTLYVYHNAGGSPAKVALTGSGIEVPKPIIKIAATSVTFDTTYIGSNNQKTIAIDNEGTAPLIVSKISFDKVVFSSLQSSFTLGAGLRHILTLNFAPTSDSSYSGTLTIQHNAFGSSSQISLTGNGKKHVPNIVLSSKEINFGVITVYTHVDVSLTINNSGTADLIVTNISSSNNRFATNLTNFTVKPNESKEVILTFTPINASQYTGTLTISHNAGSGETTIPMAGAGYPVDVIVTRTISFGDITLSGNYRMVGLPGDSSIAISKTVSGTQKNDWNVFYDNGVISANQSDYLKEYDGSFKFTFKPGNGFWVVSKNGLTVSANVKPVPLAADSTYSIPLQSNWNIISNPFEKSTSWTKIKQLNGLTTHPLYKWNGQSYDQVSEMTTYEGFYFYNTAGLTSLKIPYDANGTLRKFFKVKEDFQPGERGFTISCVEGGVQRSSVYAGFNSKSSNNVDDYDYFMPPADFGEVSLVLQNDSLSTDYKKLLVEQRKEIGEGTQFDFTARNNSAQQVQITVNGIEFFLESETYLLDKQYNKFTNLKEKNVFTLPKQIGKRSYALLVGSQSFIQERKAAIIPTEYLLYQNFPNPFNPTTTIAFGLPKESNVTLTLYNMLGEVVLKKEPGSKTSGYYELLLDLSGKTSGVYFYEIQANALDGSKSFREVKKMILVK